VCSETKDHFVGIIGKGQILGMEDPNAGKNADFMTSAAVLTQNCDLYYIEREVFIRIL